MKRFLCWLNFGAIFIFYMWFCLVASQFVHDTLTKYHTNKYRVVELERQLRECEGKP